MSTTENTLKNLLQNSGSLSMVLPEPVGTAVLTHQYPQHATLSSKLSEQEESELLTLLGELFQDYPIKTITLNEIILNNGKKFNWRPSKQVRKEDAVLNEPSLIEQFIPIYIAGSCWQSDPRHDGHAGRIRHLGFFRALYGEDEEAVKRNLIGIKWLEKTFASSAQTILVTRNLKISKKLQAIAEELDALVQKLGEPCLKFLKGISGTFCWRHIANTNRLSAHSFGMTLDLNAALCEYWLWDYKKIRHAKGDSSEIPKETDIKPEEIPSWRNSVPWEIVGIFEKYGFIWGGKWNKYDSMHFEYRPECFVNPEIKLRLRELLIKDGYILLEPLHMQFPQAQHNIKMR